MSEADNVPIIHFDITRQRADKALIQFAEQAGVTLIFPYEEARQVEANRLEGDYSFTDAIGILLENTGLEARFSKDGSVAITKNQDVRGKIMSKQETDWDNFFKRLISVFGVALTAGGAVHADEGSRQGALIEEIVVTAQRREESIQDVPISISAISGNQVEQLAVNSTFELLNQIPNVSAQKPEGGTGFPVFNIRGVTLLDFSETNDASIAIYVDEVYIGSPSIQNQQLFDVDRLEVLRGPQGTLWGRNATGGLVHYVTRKPTEEFEGYVKAGYGENDEYTIEGAISGSLAESVRARLSLTEGGNDGWQENILNGKDFGGVDTRRAARLTVELDATEELMITGNIHYNKFEGDGDLRAFFGKLDPNTFQPCSPAQILNSQCVVPGSTPDPDPDPEHGLSNQSDAPVDVDSTGGWLKLDWDLGFGTLTSITSYDEAEKFHTIDVDGTDLVAFRYETSVDHEQFSQELRLTGDSADLFWVLGTYYYQDDRFYTAILPESGGFGTWADQESESKAVFGQVTWSVSDTLNLTLGSRYTRDERDLNEILTVIGGKQGTDMGTAIWPGSISDTTESNRSTWRLSADWHFTPDHMLYASASTGYKSSAYNTLLVQNPATVLPTDPELTTAFEMGVKGEFTDYGNLSYKLAVFYTDYEDIQVAATTTQGGVPLTALINAGDARIRGLELELSAQPVDGLYINVGVGLLDSDGYEAPASVTLNGNPIDGNDLVMFPETNINGSVRYEFPFPGGGTSYVMTSYSWQDDIYFGPDNLEIESQDSYGLINLYTGWISGSGGLELSAWVKNLDDEEYFTHAFDGGSYLANSWGRSQTWGVSAKKSF